MRQEAELGYSPQRLDFLAELQSVQRVRNAERARRDMNAAHVSADRSAHAKIFEQVLATLLAYNNADSVKRVQQVQPTSPLAEIEDVPIGNEGLGSVCACAAVDLKQAGLQHATARSWHTLFCSTQAA